MLFKQNIEADLYKQYKYIKIFKCQSQYEVFVTTLS